MPGKTCLIVVFLLALFLDFKLAFWVAMGDRFLGYSLNDITTFGMIIVPVLIHVASDFMCLRERVKEYTCPEGRVVQTADDNPSTRHYC